MEGIEELTLELVDECPLHCVHCSSSSGPTSSNVLPKQKVSSLISEAFHLGASKISFGGGEPTLSKAFVPAVRQTVKLGMAAEVFTCGASNCNNKLVSIPSEILEILGCLNNVKFIFSIHGATGKIHDSIAQTPESFTVLIDSLKKSIAAGFVCEFNFVPLRLNVFEFSEIIALAENIGVKRVSVLRFVPQGRGQQNREELELFREEEDCFVETLSSLRNCSHVEIRTGSPFNGIIPGNEVPCRAGHRKLVVQANGNVLPCEVFKQHSRCRWDLSVHKQTLASVFENPRFRVLRAQLVNCGYLECPIHKALRVQQRMEAQHAQVS